MGGIRVAGILAQDFPSGVSTEVSIVLHGGLIAWHSQQRVLIPSDGIHKHCGARLALWTLWTWRPVWTWRTWRTFWAWWTGWAVFVGMVIGLVGVIGNRALRVMHVVVVMGVIVSSTVIAANKRKQERYERHRSEVLHFFIFPTVRNKDCGRR